MDYQNNAHHNVKKGRPLIISHNLTEQNEQQIAT